MTNSVIDLTETIECAMNSKSKFYRLFEVFEKNRALFFSTNFSFNQFNSPVGLDGQLALISAFILVVGAGIFIGFCAYK